MELLIDVRWLLDVQEHALEDVALRDASVLSAAVARHRVNTPALGETADAAWRSAVLLDTIAKLRPLPAHNNLFGCAVAVQYMAASGEGIDPPYGALVAMVQDLLAGKIDEFAAAERFRRWRV